MLKAYVENLEGVDESLHSFYEQGEDGYTLKVEGFEDKEATGALKRKAEHEKSARKEAAEAARKLQEDRDALAKKLDDIEHSSHRDKGDVEALEKSWQDKLSKREGELLGEVEKLKGSMDKLLVDNKAIQLASELAVEGSSDVLLPHIRSRLSVDTRGDEFVTVVLGEDGKPSALTIDELKQEIAGNQAFAPIIVGSKASGGGAGEGAGGGASPNLDWSSATPAQKVAAIKAKQAS